MSTLTVQGVVESIMAMEVNGVVQKQPFPPESVSTAQLPLMYVRNCAIDTEGMSLSFSGGGRSVSCEIIILVNAARQNYQENGYAETRKLMDSLFDAIESGGANLRATEFTVSEEFQSAEITSYFVVKAMVRFS